MSAMLKGKTRADFDTEAAWREYLWDHGDVSVNDRPGVLSEIASSFEREFPRPTKQEHFGSLCPNCGTHLHGTLVVRT